MTSQETKPLISVIVPIFRVEQYLEKCVSSIIAQSYRNLEIILVDDGSDDNCPAICDRFQAEDSRIKVIHKANGGLSQARNWGLKIATGDFIGFVDGDDWIEPNMYEVLMVTLTEAGADVAVCGVMRESQESKPRPFSDVFSETRQYSSEKALKMILDADAFIRFCVWNKLYKRSLVSNISFPEGRIHEDIFWTVQAIGNAKSIACIGLPLYHYQLRIGSLSHNAEQFIRRQMNKIEMFEQSLEFLRNHYPTFEIMCMAKLQNICCRSYIKIGAKYSHLDTDKQVRGKLMCNFRRFGTASLFFFDKYTLIRMLFWFCPELVVKAYKLYSKM